MKLKLTNVDKNCLDEMTLINFVDLSQAQKISVLLMRNHPQIKKWMHNQDDILQQSHFDFIDSLKGNEGKKYFLVKYQNQDIGSFNLTDINVKTKTAEVGLYTNPFVSISKMGQMLITAASVYAVEQLKLNALVLEVFEHNQRAIDFYKKNGFTQQKVQKINEQVVFIMHKSLANLTM